jgi:hypothetical protein
VAGVQDPALHCPHASANGGGVCVENCGTYSVAMCAPVLPLRWPLSDIWKKLDL